MSSGVARRCTDANYCLPTMSCIPDRALGKLYKWARPGRQPYARMGRRDRRRCNVQIETISWLWVCLVSPQECRGPVKTPGAKRTQTRHKIVRTTMLRRNGALRNHAEIREVTPTIGRVAHLVRSPAAGVEVGETNLHGGKGSRQEGRGKREDRRAPGRSVWILQSAIRNPQSRARSPVGRR